MFRLNEETKLELSLDCHPSYLSLSLFVSFCPFLFLCVSPCFPPSMFSSSPFLFSFFIVFFILSFTFATAIADAIDAFIFFQVFKNFSFARFCFCVCCISRELSYSRTVFSPIWRLEDLRSSNFSDTKVKSSHLNLHLR